MDFQSIHRRLGGLRLLPANPRLAFRDGCAAVFAVTAAVLLLDVVVFRRSLTEDYVTFYTAPLWPRTLEMGIKAVEEEIIYRLGLMSALVFALNLVRGRVAPGNFWAAIICSQLVLVWPSIVEFPLWGSLRFWAVGCVWGWLYWKRGWVTSAVGHGVVHFLLDPILRTALLITI